ncbi:hypothetical protein KQY10_13620 [Leptospira interrogans]|uniref:Uncharacterized protein n=2 Tax=Leptospira interrogans TaxID=173 RepID=A0AAQ0AZ87_LEPIR|nr:hypothetical protein [Leptospira interrogans]ALE37767.1 hypothetical protein G436_0544 [Leptospira interrogans serovar Hardjo str. Norma]ALN99208.1 hypothetical protein LIH_02410 [Leptospira interrogans serovar Hardjo-prajitno]EKO94867.1 hypothetical protein LEP1GSC057_0541 [Leptospira interrogans str. Brem 329]MCD1166621.1 hypothetical protein [Leptospira interrogans]MCH1885156.1 hypothetical protein [Leptospira interrogans]
MVQVDKKGRKLKKSEEKRIQKIVELLEANPNAILWVELVLYKLLESINKKNTETLSMEKLQDQVIKQIKARKAQNK